MPLRPEIHLILWVSALALIVAMFFRATLPSLQESPTEANLLDAAAHVQPGPGAEGSTQPVWSRQLMEAAEGARALFPVLTAQAEQFPPPEGLIGVAPVLKGVIQSENRLLAVFVDPIDGTHRTVGAGDAVGEYQIVTVEADQVFMRSPRGDEAFQLRGAGEHP